MLDVLVPKEIERLSREIIADIEQTPIPQNNLAKLVEHIEEFQNQWLKTFARFGVDMQGELAYRDLILGFREQISSIANKWLLENSKGKNASTAINSILSIPERPLWAQLKTGLREKRKRNNNSVLHEIFPIPEFDTPLFIVCAPRAGSTLLFETLSQFADLWTIGTESHEIFEKIPELHPRSHDFSSNRLTGVDAVPSINAELRKRFTRQLRDRDRCMYLNLPEEKRPQKVRFLEKTPKNALRIPFLKAAFPGAKFIYLYREPKANISSIIEGWRSRLFIAYRNLPGWTFREWSFLLIPDWLSLQNCSLAEIATHQWKAANSDILSDLQVLPTSSWCLVRYGDLVSEPKRIIRNISEFAQLNWDLKIENLVSQNLPISSMTFSAPSANKWQKNAREIVSLLPSLESITNFVDSIPC